MTIQRGSAVCTSIPRDWGVTMKQRHAVVYWRNTQNQRKFAKTGVSRVLLTKGDLRGNRRFLWAVARPLEAVGGSPPMKRGWQKGRRRAWQMRNGCGRRRRERRGRRQAGTLATLEEDVTFIDRLEREGKPRHGLDLREKCRSIEIVCFISCRSACGEREGER